MFLAPFCRHSMGVGDLTRHSLTGALLTIKSAYYLVRNENLGDHKRLLRDSLMPLCFRLIHFISGMRK